MTTDLLASLLADLQAAEAKDQELERRLAEVRARIRYIREKLKEAGAPADAAPRKPDLREHLLKVIGDGGDTEGVSVKDMMATLAPGEANRQQVQTMLTRLLQSEQIDRVGRGLYRLHAEPLPTEEAPC